MTFYQMTSVMINYILLEVGGICQKGLLTLGGLSNISLRRHLNKIKCQFRVTFYLNSSKGAIIKIEIK